MPLSTRKEARALARRINAKAAAGRKADAAAALELKVGGANKYREVSRRLRRAGQGELQRELVKAIRREGQPALEAVRAAWLTVEVESSKGGTARPDDSTGLRRRAARATRLQVRQRGIAITTPGKRVDPKYPTLVMYLNGFPRRRPWRHPVFGHRLTWVAQRGQEVFWPTLNERRGEWRRGIEQVLDEYLRKLQ